MSEGPPPQLRAVESFPEPEFTALRDIAFADFGERSAFLTDVLAEESNKRPKVSGQNEQIPQLKIGAFVENRLIGWSYSKGEGSQLHMINSGVHPDLRRRGIYSRLIEATITYADSHGFTKIFSRHVENLESLEFRNA